MEGVNVNIAINKNALLLVGVVIVLVMSYFVFAAEIKVDKSIPWHPVQQISTSPTSTTSIDENGDGVVDHTNATLQEITDNGAVTDKSIAVGGLISWGEASIAGSFFVGGATSLTGQLTVHGSSLFERDVTVDGLLRLSSFTSCLGKLYTDDSGNILCGKDEVEDNDADPTNELQTLSISGNTLSISNGNSVTLPSSSLSCSWTGWKATGPTSCSGCIWTDCRSYTCLSFYCDGSKVTQVSTTTCYDMFRCDNEINT